MPDVVGVVVLVMRKDDLKRLNSRLYTRWPVKFRGRFSSGLTKITVRNCWITCPHQCVICPAKFCNVRAWPLTVPNYLEAVPDGQPHRRQDFDIGVGEMYGTQQRAAVRRVCS